MANIMDSPSITVDDEDHEDKDISCGPNLVVNDNYIASVGNNSSRTKKIQQSNSMKTIIAGVKLSSNTVDGL